MSIAATGILLIIADYCYFYAVSLPDTQIAILSLIRRSNCIITFLIGFSYFKDVNFKVKNSHKSKRIRFIFSDFCVDWKTGKIDLVARNGKGFFHTRLDEEWLLNKGYQKREI